MSGLARAQAAYDAREPHDDSEAHGQYVAEFDTAENLRRLASEMADGASDGGGLPKHLRERLGLHMETFLAVHVDADDRVQMMADTQPLGSHGTIAPSFDAWMEPDPPDRDER